jgi:hypothetical protein
MGSSEADRRSNGREYFMNGQGIPIKISKSAMALLTSTRRCRNLLVGALRDRVRPMCMTATASSIENACSIPKKRK